MQDRTQRSILEALLFFLRPFARSLLQAGIGFREFAEISKTAFVDVATSDYGLRGRPTNISRVAVMTGLTRKEVRRLRDKTDAGQDAVVARSTPMSDILHFWYTDPEYQDAAGKPAILSFDAGQTSFSNLVRKYGGDIPPGAMRTELKRIGAVRESENGSLEVLKRNVSGLEINDKLINGLVRILHPAAATLAHNLTSDKDKTRVQRNVSTRFVRTSDLPRLRRICADRLAEYTESIDDLFIAYETLYEQESAEQSPNRVGMVVMYYEDRGI